MLDDFTKEITRLKEAGVIIQMNADMHEKIIVIDDEITWSGSLNMLSHKKDATTEFMLRVVNTEYADIVQDMMSRHDFKRKSKDGQEYPVCPDCGGSTFIRPGFKGIDTLYCSQCDWKTPKKNFTQLAQGVPIKSRIKDCPDAACKGKLWVLRWGNGYKLACSENCGYKKDIHRTQLPAYDPFPEVNIERVSLLVKSPISLSTDHHDENNQHLSSVDKKEPKIPKQESGLIIKIESNRIKKRKNAVAQKPKKIKPQTKDINAEKLRNKGKSMLKGLSI